MEVAVAEEKKKIFRARKTMKISDRQQLETLHSVVLTGGAALSNPSPPPLLNGRHKEDGQRPLEKERNETSDSNSQATSPASPASHGSPIPLLSLNLSPSPPTCQSPKNKEENPTSPMSPFRSLNFELKKSEEEGTQGSSLNDIPGRISAGKDQDKKVAQEDAKTEKKKEEDTTVEQAATDSLKESVKNSVLESSPSVPDKKEDKDCRSEQDCTEDMEVDRDTTRTKTSPISSAQTAEKPSAKTSSSTSPHPVSSPPTIPEKDQEVKVEKPEDEKEMQGKMNEENLKKDVKEDKAEVKKVVEKMEVNLGEFKKERTDVGPKITKLSGPSSNPPPETVLADMPERSSTSGLKRPLTEGSDNKEKVERDGKRPKVEGVALEAQLELKITAKASSRLKLEKVVQQLVEDRLRVLQLTVFDQNLQELKERVEKIDCATKHQTTLNTLQAKIARLAKKFGEANQASENKRKQEALAAATAAAAAATAAAAKAAGATASPLTQRLVRTSMEVKQFPATPASTTTTVTPSQALSTPMPVLSSSIASSATVGPVVSAHTPILQLITSTANAVSSLAPGSITTQSPTGTLLVKTTPGSGMGQGQQLLIQLPLSVANGQTGTLVNLPVSTFSAVNSLSKAKTTTPTTFILKPATTMSGLQTTMSCLQTTMSPAQISLARAVYQGGAGGIGTPNAGVSVTTARAPAQFVSVAGAVSSTSSPATSGPAATGSAAPGPPQGTSLTSKTDNQTASCTPTKTTVSTPRPKGSVIDLTEDDDDVQVTGVKSATVTPSLSSPRPVITIPNNQARSSPQISPSSAGSPRVTVQHPPVDSQLKARPVSTATARAPATALPPLPSAPPPPGCLPIEAVQTTPPQQPQLKLVPSQTGIVLSWCVAETDRSCAQVDSYHLYAFHQDNSSSNSASQQWKRIGEVKALPLPMACTLTQFQSGSTYHFAVRAKDIYGRFGSFCEPQCTNVMHSNTS